MEKVNIKSVASVAGVSIASVSRVLNKKENVNPAIKAKVEEALKTTGYRRNLQASGLRAKHSYTLTLLYSDPSPSYVVDLQKGALAECDKQGYSLNIFPCNHRNDDFLERITDLVKHFKNDGVVVAPPISDMAEVINLFEENDIPYTRISPYIIESERPSVFCNDYGAAFDMTTYLLSLGHERIGFIKGTDGHSASKNRFQGYKDALFTQRIEFDESLVEQGGFSFDTGEVCARRLLKSDNKPSVIFASNDEMAAAVYKVAAQLKLDIPNNLSVVGFDDTPMTKFLWPALTTIRQPIATQAKQAVNMLLNYINDKSNEDLQISFDCELVLRESTSIYRP
ncbi:LacI family DNA-binding transcriptional regulator [Thalassomonas sp. M1454]|uniref:LacI family DNA-binding transcriptional regulator n=1 Tax=Thalassomonas sp. M1454 TaxID=2594477 RepID=UPI00117E42B5|nr:LacI family DNA-binding transcriptional regulator [Thalassomonas sp. M1454]TRX54960.1 LacI family DNA-binding transcriptional regulator [Thalassomonas sp. M1454]